MNYLVSTLFHATIPSLAIAGSRFVTVPVPVETRVVVCVSLASEKITEHTSEVGNVGLGLKLEGSAVSKVLGKLRRASLAEGRDGDGLLLLHDKLVLLGGRLGLESLPWKTSLEEVHQDVTNGLEIVTTGLLDTQVVIDGSITRSTGQRSTLTLRNVLEGSGVTVSFGQTEINAVDKVSVSAASVGDKVSGLDITVDQVARVHEFHTFKHLVGNHENSLEGESTSTLVELILEGRTKEIHNHEVVGILGSKIVDLGESGSILQFTVNLVFVTQLRTPSPVLFELHSNLLAIGANTEVNVSKGPSTDTLGDSVFRDR